MSELERKKYVIVSINEVLLFVCHLFRVHLFPWQSLLSRVFIFINLIRIIWFLIFYCFSDKGSYKKLGWTFK